MSSSSPVGVLVLFLVLSGGCPRPPYEMRVVLATLLQELELARPAGAVSKPVRRGISIGPSDGTRLVVEPRSRGA